MLKYDEVIETSGIKIPFVPEIITPKIERPMRKSRYEAGECASLRRILRAGDRLLELGGGLGLISTAAALVAGVERITTVEANPRLIDLIRETHRLNKVGNVDLRHGVVTAEDGPAIPFYLRSDFWGSSMEGARGDYVERLELPRQPIAALIEELRPTVISCDIEGGELGLFDAVDLSGVRAMILEFHPKVYGQEKMDAMIAGFAARGLVLGAENKAGSTVQYFERAETPAKPLGHRSFRPTPMTDPRFFLATCMKDEGPFILEWLAWHKSLGVTDITVFTNDCSDGTDLLLDRLDAMGHLRHLPNPAGVAQSTAFQPIALAYAHHLPQMRQADYFLSIDVDEFINIRVGDGTLAALLAQTGHFDALSISEVNHGANLREHYERGWLTELFPAHQTSTPGKWKARRGVKTITRLSERVQKLRNHRPDLDNGDGKLVWLDGSGRPTAHFAEASENGHDVRGSYNLVRLEHFALRSLDSYLAKMYRGDVVVTGKRVSHTYWRMRNHQSETSNHYETQLLRAKAWSKKHLEKDKGLMALHEACCKAHEARIAQLVQEPEFMERRQWALTEAWTGAPGKDEEG